MVERLSKLEADVKKDLPNSQKILLDFKEEQKQWVTQIQQVQILSLSLMIHKFLIAERLYSSPLSGEHGLVLSN